MTDTNATEDARREDADGVITVTFTRDRKLNAVSAEMLDMLRAAAADLAERDDLRALIITGEGPYFTAGVDITAMPVRTGPGLYGPDFRRVYRQLHQLFDELEAIEKPVILAAQGPCLGVGVELSGSCDFRFASDRAHFGLPEVRNIATLPGSGGIARVVRLVGPAWTKWLAMASQNISAERALMIGLVHDVFPEDELMPKVREFVQDLLSQPREALGVAKIVIDGVAFADRRLARDLDRITNTALCGSAEHQAKLDEFARR